MKTREEYIESLRKLKLNVWMFGEKIKSPVDHPIIIPSMNAVALTYELAHDPEYQDLMTATSHLTGKRINRFTHIFQNERGFAEKSAPAEAARTEDRLLLPAMRRHGRPQRTLHHHL